MTVGAGAVAGAGGAFKDNPIDPDRCPKPISPFNTKCKTNYNTKFVSSFNILGALTDGSTVEERMYVKDFKVNAADVRKELLLDFNVDVFVSYYSTYYYYFCFYSYFYSFFAFYRH